jgi:NSS family neurotransmitter:Na+ symporter
LIIIVLAVRSVTLPGAREGIEFLFKPDFSKLDGSAILAALGQAFFSLSLGMGALITYGSYISKKEKLSTTAVQVTIADTSVAILAGVAIFPAVFAFGISPAEGPGLVYKTLPVVFQQMPAGILFGFLFFTLLLVAALTSSISVLEVVVAYFVEELKMHRRNATIMAAALITIFGILCSLSLGVLEIEFFDIFDFIASNILLPLGGLLISLFIGFYLEEKMVHEELSNKGKLRVPMFKFFIIVMRYIAPVAIGAVFLNEIGLFQLISKLF